ncbi:hypothetical protein ATCC90586_001994 [Pythium insidiosum]|nr:hypothetical protein ATCC90586_001994 [Pythium insidiosum]
MDLDRILNSDAAVATEDTTAMRSGKWTEEEERFAAALIRYFVAGSLSIPTGTSLRGFLARKLCCSAMRVSTKLAMDVLGDLVIPKKVGQKRFFPRADLHDAQRQCIHEELRRLEVAFLEKEGLPIVEDSAHVTAEPSAADSPRSVDAELEEFPSSVPQRIGSWSTEEQIYASALIDAFLQGRVQCATGTSLRAFLAERLSCNPMRVSKKLATGKMADRMLPKRLGSAAYRPQHATGSDVVARTECQLKHLYGTCFTASAACDSRPRVFTPPPSTYTQLSPAHDVMSVPAQASVSPLSSGMKRKASFLPTLGAFPLCVPALKRVHLPSLTALTLY